MFNIHAPTLSVLLDGDLGLKLWCRSWACRDEYVISAEVAVARFGSDCSFLEAARRTDCRRCGAKGQDEMTGAAISALRNDESAPGRNRGR